MNATSKSLGYFDKLIFHKKKLTNLGNIYTYVDSSTYSLCEN